MYCMKCGRETENEQVFCQDCLQVMEKYPVHPLTTVSLPERREPSVIKKITKHYAPTYEDQLKVLRKWVLILSIALTVCIAAILLMIKPTLHYVLDEHVEIGQNYSTVITTNTTDTPELPE